LGIGVLFLRRIAIKAIIAKILPKKRCPPVKIREISKYKGGFLISALGKANN